MTKITINRAPVLSLWAFVVAKRLGHSHDTALTLAKAIAGMSAYAKAKSLGLVEEREPGERKEKPEARARFIVFMGRRIPVAQSPSGPLALASGKPIPPKSVEKYLAAKFGEHEDAVVAAMTKLARSRTPAKLAAEAFHLYEAFRPSIPAGVPGWGKAGVLDLKKIEHLAVQKKA
ncbi:MAG: hypothetical protein ACXWLD_08630 [Rhizomicrobium sp.]